MPDPGSPPPLLQMIERLIAAPSVSSINPQWDQSNQRVIEPLSDWLGQLGFRVEILTVPGQPGKSNLVASAGNGPDGLVISGHSDTVPCDEALWRSNPFTLDERDNRLYGLGTSDMKAFFALVIEALKMETPVYVPCDGTVKEIKVKEGDEVAEDDVLAIIVEGA